MVKRRDSSVHTPDLYGAETMKSYENESVLFSTSAWQEGDRGALEKTKPLVAKDKPLFTFPEQEDLRIKETPFTDVLTYIVYIVGAAIAVYAVAIAWGS